MRFSLKWISNPQELVYVIYYMNPVRGRDSVDFNRGIEFYQLTVDCILIAIYF